MIVGIKINKILLRCILILSLCVSLSFFLSLSKCSRNGHGDTPEIPDNTQYNVLGTNWKGYISGELNMELDDENRTAWVEELYGEEYDSTYTAEDLVIPRTVFANDIEYDVIPDNFTLCSMYITGTIKIPSTFEYIGAGDNGVSIDCPEADEVIIPPSVTTLLARCINVKELIIPKNVTVIENSAFDGCGALTSINISASNAPSIGSATFYGCSSLKYVTLSDQLISIGMYAFTNCTALESIVFPKNVSDIYYGAFRGCDALSSITFSSNVSRIGEFVFYGLSNSLDEENEKRNLILPIESANGTISDWTEGSISLGSFNFDSEYWNITKV